MQAPPPSPYTYPTGPGSAPIQISSSNALIPSSSAASSSATSSYNQWALGPSRTGIPGKRGGRGRRIPYYSIGTPRGFAPRQLPPDAFGSGPLVPLPNARTVGPFVGPPASALFLAPQAPQVLLENDDEVFSAPSYARNGTSEIISLWLRSKAHTPSPDNDDLTILKSKDFKPARLAHAFTVQEAIRIVQDAVKKGGELNEEAFKYSLGPKDLRQLPFHLFNDIDAFLFGGVLRGNVYLKWGKKPSPNFGYTARPSKSGERIRISLSAQLLTSGDPGLLIEVLVHQMSHAFLLQCCEPKLERDAGYRHPLTHDPPFAAVMCAVQQGLKMQNSQYPSLMGCGTGAVDSNQTMLLQTRSKDGKGLSCSMCNESDTGKHVNDCLTVLLTIEQRTSVPELKLGKGCAKDVGGRLLPLTHWIHEQPGSKKPMLRTEYEKKVPDYIELRYQDRAYPVPKNKCPEPGQSKHELDKDLIDEKSFRLVFDYLTTGSWTPTSPPVLSGVDCFSLPKIAPTMPAETPYFLTQLRAHRVGAVLNLSKMREKALERLEKSGRSYCVEDPIVLLEMLYHGTTSLGANEKTEEEGSGKQDKGGEKGSKKAGSSSASFSPARPPPDRDLRTWAKGFFKAATDDKKMPSNIDVLKRSDQYKLRWIQLRLKGKALLEDADQCENELIEERERKAKKKEQEADADSRDATMKAMTKALQNMAMGNNGMVPAPIISPIPAQMVPQMGQAQMGPVPVLAARPGPFVMVGQNQGGQERESETEQRRLRMQVDQLQQALKDQQQHAEDQALLLEANRQLKEAQRAVQMQGMMSNGFGLPFAVPGPSSTWAVGSSFSEQTD